MELRSYVPVFLRSCNSRPCSNGMMFDSLCARAESSFIGIETRHKDQNQTNEMIYNARINSIANHTADAPKFGFNRAVRSNRVSS